MLPDNYLQIIIRLVLSVILGGVIGIEREGTNHDAGLRTHILVCLGSAGVMVMSQALAAEYNCDIGRFGAQVISGIGFLGAGCILVSGNHIKGLTTAACLWTTACVGLAAGIGYYFISVLMAVLMLITILAMRPFSGFLRDKEKRCEYTLIIYLSKHADFEDVTESLHDRERRILSVSTDEDGVYTIHISNETESGINRLVCSLMENRGVTRVERVK